MLKIIPCLEQLDKNLPQKLLREVNAKHILVSFPVASLGGKGKGMRDNYEKHFLELTTDWPGSIKRFEFYSELAFLLTRDKNA
jgi:16S rRNA (guanine(1405)-N(7))-methyltransferase